MFKMAFLLFAYLFLLCTSVSGQESLQLVTFHEDLSYMNSRIQTMGVSVNQEKLNEVSNNILMAENWLKQHVLSYYPSTNIGHIVISNILLCKDENFMNQEKIVGITLDSMKNIYYCLTRWGLEKKIKVSVTLSLKCVHKSYLKSILNFLDEINSTYTIDPPQFTDQLVNLMISELKLVKKLGNFRPEKVNFISPVLKQSKPTSRKLSFIDDLWSNPSPPENVVEFSPAPEIQPPASSPSPPYGFSLPPCNPYPHPYHAVPPVVSNGNRPMVAPPLAVGNRGGSVAAPPLVVGNRGGSVAAPPHLGGEMLWCVAKPSVPSEKLQEAMDYACGAGGADCGPISPNGSCYMPDSVVAHASYAFNSYWQKNKKNGGVCGFEGTAMLIASDPSFLQCRFPHG
uniref:uncharacterized protein LOC122589760 n=1 Tax=Erigeron canadensis TaxID=72917 RepID=UPI001CB98685|nr:uncharacterized protein LOC122589760 [Erigeron canadensis]